MNKDFELPTLYKESKNGKIRQWSIWTEGSKVWTEHGQKGGKLRQTYKEAKSKNIGKSNETTPREQAKKEAQSKWEKKLDKQYFKTIKEAKDINLFPMLAKTFKEEKIEFDCDIQAKMDGCVHGSTELITKEGRITIEDIVENKLDVKALSYSENKDEFEYKQVTNWFNNGKSDYSNWVEVVPNKGPHIRCTPNHKFYTNEGWVRADKLNSDKHKIKVDDADGYWCGLMSGTLLGDSMLAIDKRASGTSYRLLFSHVNKELLNFKISKLNIGGRIKNYSTGFGSEAKKFTSYALTGSKFPLKKFYHIGNHKKCGKRKFIPYKHGLQNLLIPESLSLWIADDGSLSYNNGNKKTPRLSINTHRYSNRQLKAFLTYFNCIWDTNPTPIQDKRVNTTSNSQAGKFLQFNTKDTLLILNALRNKHVKGAEYKFYFPTEGYIRTAKNGFTWSKFHTRKARYSSKDHIKYDIEVKDNHNYVANGIVIHNCRTLSFNDNGKIKFKSRGGKYFENLDHIAKDLEPIFKIDKDIVLDGEIYNHNLSFQKITKYTKKYKKGKTDRLSFNVYDCFYPDKTDKTWIERKNDLSKFLPFFQNTRSLKHVNSFTVKNSLELISMHQKLVSEGYEGSIIRLHLYPYELGHRSSGLFKLKDWKDDEFKIIDYKEGEGTMRGCVKWVCLLDNGNTVTVSPQGSREERQQWLQEGPEHVGKMLKVKFFGKTEDGSLRFPTGIAIRPEKDM